MRASMLLVRTRGNMAEGEGNSDIVESSHDLTITDDQNASGEIEGASEIGEKELPYNYGFSLPEYYKLSLQYYHKGMPVAQFISAYL